MKMKSKLLTLGLTSLFLFGCSAKINEITYSDLQTKINNEDDFILLLTSKTCGHCKNLKQTIKKSNYNFDIVEISMDDVIDGVKNNNEEYIETYKMEGNLEEVWKKTIEAFSIAFRPAHVARCYRNLGYYFVEKKKYSEAISAYMLSLRYEKDSKQVQSELYYINQVSGGVKEPSIEEIKMYAEKYGFPVKANDDIIGLAYTYGKHFSDDGKGKVAKYFFNIVYDLTNDHSIKELIDSIPDK